MSRIADYIENLHCYGIDPRQRRVYLPKEIAPSGRELDIGTDTVIRNLLLLDKDKKGPIELWVNTPGGDFYEMWAIIDVMHSMDNEVHTVALGSVSSAGCLILASGTGTRYTMPNTSFMWHAGTTGVHPELTYPEARDRLASEGRGKERWVEAMAKVTKPRNKEGKVIRTLAGKKEYWNFWAEHGGELWLDAKGMLRNGVVDEIWSK